MVAAIASSIAASFKAVGLVENRVSIVADTLSPGGAGPVRSVNTPTIAGRRFGSANPLRSVVLLRRLVVLILDGGGVGRNADESREGPASDEVISMRWQPAPAPGTAARWRPRRCGR